MLNLQHQLKEKTLIIANRKTDLGNWSKRIDATCFFLSNQEDEVIKGTLLPDTRHLHIHHILQPSPSLHHLTLGQSFEDIQLLPGNNQQLGDASYISDF
jgi:hypothetical protein